LTDSTALNNLINFINAILESFGPYINKQSKELNFKIFAYLYMDQSLFIYGQLVESMGECLISKSSLDKSLPIGKFYGPKQEL